MSQQFDRENLKPVIWEYMTNLKEKSYLQNLTQKVEIGFGYDSDQENIADDRFKKLIEVHQLQSWVGELNAFRYYLNRVQPFNTPEYDFLLWGTDLRNYNRELSSLKNFIYNNKYNNKIQIKFTTPKDRVNISNSWLLEELLATVKSKIDELELKIDIFPDIKYKTSHGKNYTKNALFPFYKFISIEVLPGLTNIKRCKFIADFTATFYFDWRLIQSASGQLPEDYLENFFNKSR